MLVPSACRSPRWGILAITAALLGPGSAAFAVNEPPVAPVVVTVGTNTAFAGGEGLSAPTRFEVWRSGIRIATTPTLAPTGGLVEINHLGGPVDACWVGTTPDLKPGDKVRAVQGTVEDQTTVPNLTIAAPVNPSGAIVEVHGSATLTNGQRPPIDELGVLIRNPTVGGGGGTRFFAPGAGTLTYDVPGDTTNGAFTAHYDFTLTPANVGIAMSGAAETSVEWLTATATEVFVAEAGGTPTPQAPCAAPTAVGPLGVSLTSATDSGASATDGITNVAAPSVTGLTTAGATVNLYVDGALTPTATGTAGLDGVFTIALPALTEGPHSIGAREVIVPGAPPTELASNVPLAIQIDLTGPAAPTGLATDPPTPSNQLAPRVLGSAEAGSSVRIHRDSATCLSASEATGTAAAFAAPGILVGPYPQNAVLSFTASAVDLAGNVSACSDPVAYITDGTPPAPPASLQTAPLSPGSDPTPSLSGTVGEAGTTIRVYLNATCAGAPAVTVPAGATSFSVDVPVQPNQGNTIAATARDSAGNTSTCSAAITYLHDGIAPAAPSNLSTTPASPSNVNTPFVRGLAEAGSTVGVYVDDPACGGGGDASGSAAAFAGAGLQIPPGPIANDEAVEIYASARDLAGNISACAGPVSYQEDSTAPPAAAITAPAPGTTTNLPTFTFTGQAGATFECSMVPTGLPADFAPCVAPKAYPGLTGDGGWTFSVRQTDQAGNAQTSPAATRAITLDTTPPGIPVITAGPTGTSKSRDAVFTYINATVGGSDTRDCSLSTGADEFVPCDATTFSRTGLTDGTYTFKVRVRDIFGNAGIATRQFTVDNAPPAVTVTGGPGAVTSNNLPVFSFTSNEAGVTFECGIANGAPATFNPCGSPVTMGPLANGDWIFAVRATDGAGNVGVPATYGFKLQPPVLVGAASVTTRNVAMTRAGKVALTLRCTGPSGASCSGLVDIVRRIPATAAAPARNLLFGRARVTMLAGQTVRVTVTLTRTGRSAVLRAPGRRLALRTIVTPTGGQASNAPLRVGAPAEPK